MINFDFFNNGIFQVNSSGKVNIDFLDDDGRDTGELAIFSLQEMEQLEIGSQEFLQEAINRALSNSKLGYVLTQEYLDIPRQSFLMQEGDRFAIMLIRHGTILDIAANPKVENVLFSFDTFRDEPDHYEVETHSCDFNEQILISNIF
nr:hypothetical protein [Pleurocapsa sp. MO_192.B19]